LGALEEMLTTWPGCALVVTHDRYFLNRVATSVLAFERGKSEVLHYPGGYDDYRAIKQEQAEAAVRASSPPKKGQSVPPPKEAPKKSAPPPPVGKALTYGERIELEKILEVIAGVEDELTLVDQKLADPTVYSSKADAKALEESRTKLTRMVAELTSRWEDLESRKDVKK
jgi:ATP-binding cassette subfamily F protein uup